MGLLSINNIMFLKVTLRQLDCLNLMIRLSPKKASQGLIDVCETWSRNFTSKTLTTWKVITFNFILPSNLVLYLQWDSNSRNNTEKKIDKNKWEVCCDNMSFYITTEWWPIVQVCWLPLFNSFIHPSIHAHCGPWMCRPRHRRRSFQRGSSFRGRPRNRLRNAPQTRPLCIMFG